VGIFLIFLPPAASPAPTENAGEACREASGPAGKAGPAAPMLKLKPVPGLGAPGVPGVPGVEPNMPGCGPLLFPNPLEGAPNIPVAAAGCVGAPNPPKPTAGAAVGAVADGWPKGLGLAVAGADAV